MISFLAAVALARSQQDLPLAKDLIGRMFVRYYKASTVQGKIRLTVAAFTGAVTVDTTLALQRPDKLFLRQRKSAGEKQDYLVTADGKEFTYDPPSTSFFTNDSRLLEKMGPNAAAKDLQDAYAASTLSICDRSAPLDVAIARTVDLDYFRRQLATIKTESETEINGKKAYLIDGAWRPYGNAQLSGKFALLVSPEGDLFRYVIKQTISVPGSKMAPQEVVQTWDVDLKTDLPIEAAVFTVVK